ncbi:MAG: hypothetical protein ACO3QH_09290, partial [Ilumatobacteraceae bacterium]
MRPANVAVPETAATEVVPPSVPPDGVAVTVAVDVVMLSPESSTRTTGCVLNASPTNCVVV